MYDQGTVDNDDENERYRLRMCGNCGEKCYTVEFEVIANDSFIDTYKKYRNIKKHGKR